MLKLRQVKITQKVCIRVLSNKHTFPKSLVIREPSKTIRGTHRVQVAVYARSSEDRGKSIYSTIYWILPSGVLSVSC